jgi:hypothetical protein
MLAAQRVWDLHTFPYSRTMGKWGAAKQWQLLAHSKSRGQRQEEQPPVVKLDSDSDSDLNLRSESVSQYLRGTKTVLSPIDCRLIGTVIL